MTTLAILFPGSLGFHLFVRWPRDRVRRCSAVVHASDLADALGPLGDPLVVGLVGTRQMEFVASQVLEFADLVAIPDCWLRRVPRRDLQRRAEVAARILTAHRTDPLRHYLGRERADLSAFLF
jgi:hypothetical protein